MMVFTQKHSCHGGCTVFVGKVCVDKMVPCFFFLAGEMDRARLVLAACATTEQR